MSFKNHFLQISVVRRLYYLLKGQIGTPYCPWKTITIDVEPGEYELDVKGSNEEDASMCKPIQVKIGDGKTVHLKIVANTLL